jgi:hypothetical protein
VTCFLLLDLVDDKEAAVRLLSVNAPYSRLSSNFTQVFRPITNGLMMRATVHLWFDSFGRRKEARTARSGSWSRFTAEPFAAAYCYSNRSRTPTVTLLHARKNGLKAIGKIVEGQPGEDIVKGTLDALVEGWLQQHHDQQKQQQQLRASLRAWRLAAAHKQSELRCAIYLFGFRTCVLSLNCDAWVAA